MNGLDIKRRREELGLAQQELANKIGVSRNTIINYEKGGVIPEPKRQMLEAFLFGDEKQEAIPMENPFILMIPLVSQYAYAGYLAGFSDSEYMGSLPKIPIIADHQLKGDYIGFEVRGDSMDNDTSESIREGDRLICRFIKQELWQYKLHINKWNFVIVHKTDGVLVKRITDHNVDQNVITIHSLNPEYPDKAISLNEVSQLFNVVEIVRSGRI